MGWGVHPLLMPSSRPQDEELGGGGGFNTSDEEFERQLEEAAIMEAEEKMEKARKPKMKKGRGKNARRRIHLKKTSSFPTNLDAEGYEVSNNRRNGSL